MFVLNPFQQSIIATWWVVTYSGGKVIHTFTTDDTFQITGGTGEIEVFMRWGGWAGWRPGCRGYWAPGWAAWAAYWKIIITNSVSYNVAIWGGGNYVTGATPIAHWGGSSCYNGSDPAYGGGGGGFSWLFNWTISQANAIMIAGGGGGGGSSRAWTGNSGWGGWGVYWQAGQSPYDGKSAYAWSPGTDIGAWADASCQSPNTNGNQWALQGGNSRINSYGWGGWGWYRGWSGGGYSESNTMGWGWGGSGYLKPGTVTNWVLYAANGTTAWNYSNSYKWTYWDAGSPSVVWNPGIVVITYAGAEDVTLWAKLELAKITDIWIATLPHGTSNTKSAVESAIIVLANAMINVNYTVTIDSWSTYNDSTNAWVWTLVVTHNSIAVNIKKDNNPRSITITIIVDSTPVHTSKTFDSAADLSSDWWTPLSERAGWGVSSWVWYWNNTDGHSLMYKTFAAWLTNLIITHTSVSCSWSDAWRGASWYVNLYAAAHSWAVWFDPAEVVNINREMYASAAVSYNGVPTYHRSALTRKIAWARNNSWANRESIWNTARDATLVQQLEFNNWNWTYRVWSNWVLVTTYTFSSTFTRIYSIQCWVWSSTGSHPQVDEITLWHNT